MDIDRFQHTLLMSADVTYNESKVMFALMMGNGMSQCGLMDLCDMVQSEVSKVLKKLEQRGWVTKYIPPAYKKGRPTEYWSSSKTVDELFDELNELYRIKSEKVRNLIEEVRSEMKE